MTQAQPQSKWETFNGQLVRVGLILVILGMIGLVALPIDYPFGALALIVGGGATALAALSEIARRIRAAIGR